MWYTDDFMVFLTCVTAYGIVKLFKTPAIKKLEGVTNLYETMAKKVEGEINMNNLKLTRIDFRLIHGQVMTRWVKEHNIKDIVVIDDKSAKSPILKKILLSAAPSSVNVLVESVASAAEKWQASELPKNNLLILFKDPKTAARAWQEGIAYKELQIGGIEGSGEKKNINKNIVMSEEDVLDLKPLHENGVRVYGQPIPEDSEYPFESILNKFS